MKQTNKQRNGIFFLAFVVSTAVYFGFKTVESPIRQSQNSVIQKRGLASIQDSQRVFSNEELILTDDMEIRDEKTFFLKAKEDSMSLESFKIEVEKISKQIGWDLVVEVAEDGKTHIKNKQVVQDFKDDPLPAFSPEQWTSVQENLLDIVNQGVRPQLTRDDHLAIEKWNASN